ncbi:hypothetical protein [Bacillus sp. SM2101]|uniref:hypothetical protein n=1 Tax=Bacillus sp. SM2101 TaxID=2805366 RepID=UPI001BDE054A|nr:hypothetical protein [Bacillus sp. SM2101]
MVKNCKCNDDKCPQYFKLQTDSAVNIIPDGIFMLPLALLPLTVLIKNKDAEIKLDSSVEFFVQFQTIQPLTDPAFITFNLDYILQRSTNGGDFNDLTTIKPSQTFVANSDSFEGAIIPNLTWTDKPGIGCHVYRILIPTFNSEATSIEALNINILTRSLNSIVFCH